MIEWSGRKWLTQERWGMIHPRKPWNWYDSDNVNIDTMGNLNLSIGYNKRIFDVNGEKITSLYGTGLVCCQDNFGFGTFEIRAKLPKGKGLWPAFWMYPSNAWPPEIDIFEGYSEDKNYKSWCFFKPYKVDNCTHSDIDAAQPVKRPWFWKWNNHPAETFNTYTLKWTPDELIFYINNNQIRKITNKKTLNELAQYDMMIIINNHIDGNFVNNFTIETPFIIEYFHYKKLK